MPSKSRAEEAVKSHAWCGNFPLRLKELMEETNTTQQALGEAIGVTRQAISNYLTGVSGPDWEKLAKISRYFGVSADYLVGNTDVQSSDTDIQAACRYTGLPEAAVVQLQKIVHSRLPVSTRNADGFPTVIMEQASGAETLSKVIAEKRFYDLIRSFMIMERRVKECNEALQSSRNLLYEYEKLEICCYRAQKDFEKLLEALYKPQATLEKLREAMPDIEF